MGSKKDIKESEEMQMTPSLTPRKKKKHKWPIVLGVLLIIAALIFFFRKPILNVARGIPFVSNYIGKAQEPELSPEEMKNKVAAQTQEIEDLKKQVTLLQEDQAKLIEKNESLKQYETMYTDFITQKEEWDAEVAQTNPELFIKQFEQIYPDHADRIYATLKGKQVVTDQQKEIAATIGSMDEEKAAAALEKLLTTDSELIKFIFDGMSKDSKAAVLSEMTSESAAQVIKLISPDETVTQ